MNDRTRQRIRYLHTADSVKLAWAESGSGALVIKAANWLTHLEYDWESPVWRHWIRFFSGHTRFVRYDERGCGMTDWNVGDISFARWIDDLEQVVAVAAPEEPFTLLGISQGAAVCVAYAASHPERVSSLILYGGYSRGWARRNQPEVEREHQAIVALTLLGWGKDNPAYREVFTSRYIPGGTRAQLDWYNELCRKTTSPAVAAELQRARGDIDVSSVLDKVRARTLVLHARDDAVVPIATGRLLAASIAGAEFVELDSRNHVLLEDEPAWERFCGVVREFLGLGAQAGEEDAAFRSLTARERGVLGLITEGLSNAEIAERLSLSEKTVRNHTSNIFDKLGVWTRAQAMVFARDRGFRG
jgi:pimeloyl-ACP methyl ester carboxylesterase/DNA-binding CsgD family transcriptional regulator